MNELEEFRREIDQFMKNHPQSPLDDDQRQDFNGLDYFDYNQDLVMEVEVDRFPEDEPVVTMQTSTGDTQEFKRWGKFTFQVDDDRATMVIYSDTHGHEFFMPFKDSTNGSETYGAGRYLDDHRPGLRQLGPYRFEIDFNYSYNPYCAYNLGYSCPLPPRENWLKVPIRAGEKDFEK